MSKNTGANTEEEDLPEGWTRIATLLDENDDVTEDTNKAVKCIYTVLNEKGEPVEHGVGYPEDFVR
ncbi:MAG: hypothetical protein L6N96_00795 [Candidatus Methylarchaceae archaeon HK02M2]|nr:hypothetical protein [Candidatus Methylarchaceae archaeon HK02M2]